MTYEQQIIIELQGLLREISRFNPAIPAVIEDGIYGDETRAAVSAFQRYYGLPVTGSTDPATWDAIAEIYRLRRASTGRSTPIYPFETTLDGGRVKEGEASGLVYIIQLILDAASIDFAFPAPLMMDGIYGPDTAQNVAYFQSVHGIPESGIVDFETWNALAEAFNKYNRVK
ncbi:MAG: peptidoglycan-binding protein [Clostridia bacterium]|nr:peptidoglycan-binding protein [Clostridia bacterium]